VFADLSVLSFVNLPGTFLMVTAAALWTVGLKLWLCVGGVCVCGCSLACRLYIVAFSEEVGGSNAADQWTSNLEDFCCSACVVESGRWRISVQTGCAWLHKS
jgi:hypothetical protein